MTPRGALAAVLLCGALVLAPLRHAAYIQDDHLAIERNPIVARGDLREILSTDYWAGAQGSDEGLYRPTTIASYAWEVALRGRADPYVSHLVNLALHLAVSCVLLLLALRLGAGLFGATVAGLLFALHPQHVEPVGNVVGRAELLAALGALGALVLWARTGTWNGERAPSPARARAAAWAAAAALLLGMGAKEVAVVALAWLLLADLLWRPPVPGALRPWLLDRAAALAPSVLAVEIYLILRVRALHAFPGIQHVHPTDNPLLLLQEPQRTASALALLARYVRLFVWPAGLAIDVSGPVFPPEPSLLAPRALAGLLLLLAAAGAVLAPFLLRGTGTGGARILALAAAVFLLPYLVISNLLVPVGALFADRFFYLPSAGLCLAAGAGAAALSGTGGVREIRDRRWLLALLLLALLCGTASFLRTRVWRSDATIFADALRVHPNSPRAHFILGKLAGDAGREAEALASFDRATAAWPDYIPAYQEKGVVLGRMGRLAEAEEAFRETLRRSPAYDAAHYNLGLVLRRQGRSAEAERELVKALRIDPTYARAWAELGHLLSEQGRRPEAAEAYRHAVALGREDLRGRLAAMGG
ncbi:MAG TPA: tetratricopeptide repeat protein [Candidatus Polarisedimenticolaceae bacterium]|nr:tetratricopeptide repeat protein [Candidatus Polarisedimenticolaceae bacterium]